MSVAALYANLPYTSKMIQRITLASEDRNYQPRSYSLIWLHILLLKIGIDRSYIGHHDSSFIEAANKVFMKLLKDANLMLDKQPKNAIGVSLEFSLKTQKDF